MDLKMDIGEALLVVVVGIAVVFVVLVVLSLLMEFTSNIAQWIEKNKKAREDAKKLPEALPSAATVSASEPGLETGAAPVGGEIEPEVAAAIAAAVMVTMGPGVAVSSVQLLENWDGNNRWAQWGRYGLMNSYKK